METVPCPISNSKEFNPYLKVPDRFDSSITVQWNLVRSCASGLIMLNPRPDNAEIAVHYRNSNYDPYRHSQNSSSLKERAYLASRSLLLGYRAGIIMKGWVKPMEECAVLEIGCSNGDLLNYFHCRSGVPINNLAGVEPDAEAADYARNSSGLNIFPSMDDETLGKQKFDRIVFWHSLEHIHTIQETLNSVANQLKPDGVLVIALPNPASVDAELYGENWIAYDAPRHLYHFWPGTLEKLLESHKLTVFKRHSYFPDLLYNIVHSEALLCKRQKQRFNVLRIAHILGMGSVEALKAGMGQTRASSLIYYARRAS